MAVWPGEYVPFYPSTGPFSEAGPPLPESDFMGGRAPLVVFAPWWFSPTCDPQNLEPASGFLQLMLGVPQMLSQELHTRMSLPEEGMLVGGSIPSLPGAIVKASLCGHELPWPFSNWVFHTIS